MDDITTTKTLMSLFANARWFVQGGSVTTETSNFKARKNFGSYRIEVYVVTRSERTLNTWHMNAHALFSTIPHDPRDKTGFCGNFIEGVAAIVDYVSALS